MSINKFFIIAVSALSFNAYSMNKENKYVSATVALANLTKARLEVIDSYNQEFSQLSSRDRQYYVTPEEFQNFSIADMQKFLQSVHESNQARRALMFESPSDHRIVSLSTNRTALTSSAGDIKTVFP